MKSSLKSTPSHIFKSNFWKNNKSLFLFVSLMLVFRSAVADWNDVPSGSMQPTITIGDRLLVDKMAYDLRIPFTHTSLKTMENPAHGDIIIFDSNVSDKKLVKRVIGLPGDVVSMSNNKLTINGSPLQYSLSKSASQESTSSSQKYAIQTEQLFGIKHQIKISSEHSPLSNFSPVKVPKNHYLVLGDNRDNSADSRVIGFVPRNEIVGRATKVVFSLNYNNYYLPKSERFLVDL